MLTFTATNDTDNHGSLHKSRDYVTSRSLIARSPGFNGSQHVEAQLDLVALDATSLTTGSPLPNYASISGAEVHYTRLRPLMPLSTAATNPDNDASMPTTSMTARARGVPDDGHDRPVTRDRPSRTGARSCSSNRSSSTTAGYRSAVEHRRRTSQNETDSDEYDEIADDTPTGRRYDTYNSQL